MIMDKFAEFADAVALNTGAADNYVFGSTYDLGAAHVDPGNGQPLYLCLSVDEAVDSAADNAVIEFQLRSDAVTPINPDTGTLHFSTGPLAQATLQAGAKFCFPLPIEGVKYERYLGLVQVTSVAAATAGKINAFLAMDPWGWQGYPDAVS